MAQLTPPNWDRQWPPHHQNGDYVVVDPRVVQYDQHAAPTTALPRSMMAPPYMVTQPYSQGPMASIPASQYQSQPPPLAYSSYTSSPTSAISPFHDPLRLPSLDSDHGTLKSHQESPRSGSVPSSRTLSATSDNRSETQNAIPTSIPVPGISKTVAPIITAGPKMGAHTVVDELLKAIQAMPETDGIVAKVEEGIKQEFEHRHLEELRCGELSQVKVEASLPPSRLRDLSKQGRKKEKRFFCQFPGCTAGFSQRPHLTIHLRTHNKEKPYACRYCSMRFTQTGNRKSHETTHSQVRPYACALGCGKYFRQRSTAKQHLKTHSNVREFVCKLCDSEKRFALRGNLKTHLVAFHKEEVAKFCARVTSITKVNDLPEDERDLFSYFATLFKNCNKGIKGRGKNKDKIREFGQFTRITPPATNSSCSSSSTSPIAMHAPMHSPHFHESQQQHHTQLPVININDHHHHPQQHSPVHHHHGAHGISLQDPHHDHTTHILPSVYSMCLPPPPLVTSISMTPPTTMAYDIQIAGSTSGIAASGAELDFGERLCH